VDPTVTPAPGSRCLPSLTNDERPLWQNNGRLADDSLEQQYDPEERFPGLYEKAVLRQ
jgi:hypothetical protein